MAQVVTGATEPVGGAPSGSGTARSSSGGALGPSGAAPRRRQGTRLKGTEFATVLRLLTETGPDGKKLTLTAIADLVGCKRGTVAQIRSEYVDTSGAALARLRATAEDAADDWILARQVAAREGKHQAAKEQLEAAGVIERKEPGAAGASVQVFIGIGQQPTGPDPWAPVPVSGTVVKR